MCTTIQYKNQQNQLENILQSPDYVPPDYEMLIFLKLTEATSSALMYGAYTCIFPKVYYQKGISHIGEFFQGGFFSLEVVTFFVTLRADLEDYFKCKT